MRKLEQYQPEKQKKGEQTGLISVIVTVYNIREYLPKAVDSILSSTYQNLEVLLIDDGSTDGSERICDEYAKKDGRRKRRRIVLNRKEQCQTIQFNADR